MAKTILIHSKKANLLANVVYEEFSVDNLTVINDDLIFTEKLKLIDTTIHEYSSLGKFEHLFKMRRDPNIIHELLARGYSINKYDPEFTIISWSK